MAACLNKLRFTCHLQLVTWESVYKYDMTSSSLRDCLFSAYVSALILRVVTIYDIRPKTWWRHQMETFSALLAICVGNSPVTGEFPAQRLVTRSFHVFFHLCLINLQTNQ